MRLLLAALFAALTLTGCASAGKSSLIAAGAPAVGGPEASAPFYLEWGTATPAVRVINGFTGRAEAVIAAPAGAGSFPWVGRTTWYPCGAAPDDRTFLLCGTDRYYELRLGDDGKPQRMSGPADIPVAARNTGSNGDPEFAVSPDRRLAAVATGAHLIAYCGTPGVVNGTRFTPVHLHVPDTSGTDFTGVLLW